VTHWLSQATAEELSTSTYMDNAATAQEVG